MSPNSFIECFCLDEHELNPVPEGIFKKIIALLLDSRYSMSTLMRLCQFFFKKSQKTNHIYKKFYRILASIFMRINQSFNNFEHGINPKIAAGVVFHHSGVCVTSDTVIESGVHVYRNVTFGAKNGRAHYIRKYAKIGSHSILLGEITIGEKAIVAPGAVVVKDVPANKVVAGIPAKIIGDVSEKNYDF